MHQASVPCFERVVSDGRPFSIGIRFEVSHFVLIDIRRVLHFWTVSVNSDIFQCKEIHISAINIYFFLPCKEHLKTTNHRHYCFLDVQLNFTTYEASSCAKRLSDETFH
jgi:hypothetical protein